MIGTLLDWVSLLGFLVLGLLGMPICVGAVIIPLALLMWALLGFRKAFRTCSGAVIGMTVFCLN